MTTRSRILTSWLYNYMAITLMIVALSTSASGQSRPFGSVYSGLGYGAQWGYNWYGNDYDAPGSRNPYAYKPQAKVVNTAPYLTGKSYEPGDGYRYPLYYNPSTASYIYYPVAR